MSRAANQYLTSGPGLPGSFPFAVEHANYRSPDFQARLMRYAELSLTAAEKQELSPLRLQYLPSDLPALQHSFVNDDAKQKAGALIKNFFILDCAYTAIGHIKKGLEYARANANEQAAKLVTGIFHNVNGFKFKPDGPPARPGVPPNRRTGYTQLNGSDVLKWVDVMDRFPGVTAPIGDTQKALDDQGKVDGADQLLYPFATREDPGTQSNRVLATDLHVADILTLLSGGNDTFPSNEFSLKSRMLVFQPELSTQDLLDMAAKITKADMSEMGSQFNIGGAFVGTYLHGQQALQNSGVTNLLKTIRVGAYTAAQFEHDTLLNVVVGINKELYTLLKTLDAQSGSHHKFLTGEDQCNTPGSTMAWRIPVQGQGPGQQHVFLTGKSAPIDDAGLYYPNAELVCADTRVAEAQTGPPGRTMPVRVSAPATPGNAGAAQRRTRGARGGRGRGGR